MRLNNEELNKIKEKYKVNELWSYSRLEKYKTSHYEYYLRYIKHEQPKGEIDSAYAPLGGIAHDILEKLYTNQIKYEDMHIEFDDMWTMNISVLDFKFNRSEAEKNDSIKNKYYKDLNHFFRYHSIIPYNVINEKFVAIPINANLVFQGYIDAIFKDENDVYNIIDWKTSTKYSGSAVKDHSAQLLLYAAALNNLGISFDKIKIGWNFIKYVNVDCLQVNGKWKTSSIERCQIGEKLQSKVKVWLNKLGYSSEDIDNYLGQMLANNSIDYLPDDVKEKFSINDCYVFVDNIEENFNKLKEEIIEIVSEIEEKKQKFSDCNDEHIWYDDEDSIKKQSYYYANLCEYSINQLKPYREYLEKQEQEKEDPFSLSKSAKQDNSLSWVNDLF